MFSLQTLIISVLVTHVFTQSTRINFGSCNHQDIPNAIIWESIVSRNPDLWIWTGDVVYLDHDVTASYPYSDYSVILYVFNAFLLGNPDVPDPHTWLAKYDLMKDNLQYQKLKNLTTIIGVWDDHDIGKNNAEYTWKHKDYAQVLFYDFMQIPQNHTKRARKGVYDFYEMKNQISVVNNNMTFEKIIDIVMFDTRYFAKQDGEEDILSNEQWEWFEDILQNKLNGELLIVISAVQIMNNPPLHSREGWYKYDESQQKLFRLLKKYNTDDRLLLISGDVHRSEIMHSQCVDNETYDFYEVTSSGITHAMFFESPYVEKFSYTLDDYAREDGVTGCSWLGRNFGELNIDWYYDDDANDVKIRNVSVEIRDENGAVKCMLDLPLWGYSDLHEYDSDSNYLWSNDFHTCYGAETFHTKHGVPSVQALCGLSWVLMVLYPNVFIVMIIISIIQATIKCCCTTCDVFGTAQPPRLRSDTAGGNSVNAKRPDFIGRNDNDIGHFDEEDITYNLDDATTTVDPELEVNPNSMIELPPEPPTLNEEETMIVDDVEDNLSNAKTTNTDGKKADETSTAVVDDEKNDDMIMKATERTETISNVRQSVKRRFSNAVSDISQVIRRKRTPKTPTASHPVDASLVVPNSLYGGKAHTETFHSHSYYRSYGYVIFKNKFFYVILITIIFLMGFRLVGPYNTDYAGNINVLIVFGIIYCCSEMCLGFYCIYAFEVAHQVSIATIGICVICVVVSLIEYKEILISLWFILADSISILSSIFIISHGYMDKTLILIIAFQIIVAGHKIYSLGSHLLYVHNEVPGHTQVGWYWVIQICLVKCYLAQFIFRSKLEYITDILYDNLLIQHAKYRKFERLFPFLLVFVFAIGSFYMATNTNDWHEGYISVGTFLEFAFMFNWPSTVYVLLWLCCKQCKIAKKHQTFYKQLTLKKISLKNLPFKSTQNLTMLEPYEQKVGQMSPGVDKVDTNIDDNRKDSAEIKYQEDSQETNPTQSQAVQVENKPIDIELQSMNHATHESTQL